MWYNISYIRQLKTMFLAQELVVYMHIQKYTFNISRKNSWVKEFIHYLCQVILPLLKIFQTKLKKEWVFKEGVFKNSIFEFIKINSMLTTQSLNNFPL